MVDDIENDILRSHPAFCFIHDHDVTSYLFDVDDDALRCGEWGQAGAVEGRLARADTRP